MCLKILVQFQTKKIMGSKSFIFAPQVPTPKFLASTFVFLKENLSDKKKLREISPGLPWIWISMDVSMDIMLSYLLIKLNI